LRSAEVYGIVFATFSAEAPDIDKWLGETRPHIDRVLGGNGDLRFAGYQKMIFRSNWKICNDNDGYHGALLHTGYSHMEWSRGDSLNLVTACGNRVTTINLQAAPTSAVFRDQALLRVLDTGIRPQTTVIAFYPSGGILRDLDVIYLRFIIPRGPNRTEAHFAYFALASDDKALGRHRAQQSANLMGISGLLAIEDAVAYHRGHAGSHTPGTIVYQKGLTGQTHGPCVIDAKGSEAANLIRWERYRKQMGFDRSEADA
jgi:phenylpropionate dioxygenase-like ring-hydroxylating dioxygenase large terminal subunit